MQAIVRRLLDADAIHLGEFEGWYDEGQEEYVTENRAEETDYKSPISGPTPHQGDRAELLLPPQRVPGKTRGLLRGEVRRHARERAATGSRAPSRRLAGRPDHEDQLLVGSRSPTTRSMSSTSGSMRSSTTPRRFGLGEDDGDAGGRHRFWPADMHVIGKEILWFHAVIWPAVLMALELPLPRCVYAHSFWISEGQKMSKSLGNFIDLPTIESYMETYGLDAWRWYMIVQGPLGATDADFQATGFHETYTTDLVNTVGNCASRTTAMIGKYFDGVVPADPGIELAGWDLAASASEAMDSWRAAMDRFALDRACEAGIGLLRTVDAFINATEPFKVAKDESRRTELEAILARCAEAVRIASLLLAPVPVEDGGTSSRTRDRDRRRGRRTGGARRLGIHPRGGRGLQGGPVPAGRGPAVGASQ